MGAVLGNSDNSIVGCGPSRKGETRAVKSKRANTRRPDVLDTSESDADSSSGGSRRSSRGKDKKSKHRRRKSGGSDQSSQSPKSKPRPTQMDPVKLLLDDLEKTLPKTPESARSRSSDRDRGKDRDIEAPSNGSTGGENVLEGPMFAGATDGRYSLTDIKRAYGSGGSGTFSDGSAVTADSADALSPGNTSDVSNNDTRAKSSMLDYGSAPFNPPSALRRSRTFTGSSKRASDSDLKRKVVWNMNHNKVMAVPLRGATMTHSRSAEEAVYDAPDDDPLDFQLRGTSPDDY